MLQKSTINGLTVESETFGVDLARLAFVIVMGQPEPMIDSTNGGDQIKGPTGIVKWQVEAVCPGMRIGGATGAAPVRVRIESAVAPKIDAYKPYQLIGPSFLTGSVVGGRNARRAQLSLSGAGLRVYSGETTAVASGAAGVPITLEGDLPTLFVNAAAPQNAYSGERITTNGRPVMRLQVCVPRVFDRKDGSGQFARNDSVFVDVFDDVWVRKPLALMTPMEFVGLRCDAYVNPMTDRVTMGLFAAGYRAIVAPTPAMPKPAPKVVEPVTT